MSLVHIYFKEDTVVQFGKEQLYSLLDIIGEFDLLNDIRISYSFASAVEFSVLVSERKGERVRSRFTKTPNKQKINGKQMSFYILCRTK